MLMAHLPLTFTLTAVFDGIHQALSPPPFRFAIASTFTAHSFSTINASSFEAHLDQQVPTWPETLATCGCTEGRLVRDPFP
jgi:hypothetical protein